MRTTLLLLLGLFVSTALVEFAVLRRCSGRRGLKACTVGVAVTSGVFWLGCWVALSWIHFGWKFATKPWTGPDAVAVGCVLLFNVVVLSGVALIPAGLVAAIYCRLKCQP